MNYSQLIAAVKGLLPGECIQVEVQYWLYDDGRESLTWQIWSAKRNEHYTGKTPEQALASLTSRLSCPAAPGEAAKVDTPSIKVEELKEIPF